MARVEGCGMVRLAVLVTGILFGVGIVWAQPAPQPPIETACDAADAEVYTAFLRQAADRIAEAVAAGADADAVIANSGGVLSVALNFLAACDGLYFDSGSYRARDGEPVTVGPIALRRGAYRVLGTGTGSVTFSLQTVGEDPICDTPQPHTLSAADVAAGFYAVVLVPQPCEVNLTMSGSAEPYGLFLNYMPRQPLALGN